MGYSKIKNRCQSYDVYCYVIGNSRCDHCWYKDFKGKVLVELFQCKKSSRQGRTEGGGQACTRSAGDQQPFFCEAGVPQAGAGLPQHPSDLDAGAFPAKGKAAADGKGAAQKFGRQHLPPALIPQALQFSLHLRNARTGNLRLEPQQEGEQHSNKDQCQGDQPKRPAAMYCLLHHIGSDQVSFVEGKAEQGYDCAHYCPHQGSFYDHHVLKMLSGGGVFHVAGPAVPPFLPFSFIRFPAFFTV